VGGEPVTCRAPLLHRMQRVFAFPSQRVHRDSSFALGMLTIRRLIGKVASTRGSERGGRSEEGGSSRIQKRNNRQREGGGLGKGSQQRCIMRNPKSFIATLTTKIR